MTQRVVTVGQVAGRASRLLAINFAACLLLLIQYLLGMAVNLYVSLPATQARPDGPAWAGVHAAFGLALVVAAFAAVALSWGRRGRMATLLSVVGGLAVGHPLQQHLDTLAARWDQAPVTPARRGSGRIPENGAPEPRRPVQVGAVDHDHQLAVRVGLRHPGHAHMISRPGRRAARNMLVR